jgi:hypothetical protein
MSKLQTGRLVDAARFTERNPEPHQAAAWNLAQGWLTPEQLDEFFGVFRSGPAAPKREVPPMAELIAASTGDVANTWEGIEMAARIAGAKFPSLVAAQWALESTHGKKPSGKNNFFGLKGSGTKKQTLEEVGGVMQPEVASFKDFPTVRACVEYLVSRWYQDYKQHKGVNRAATIEEAAQLLEVEGYATDSKYSEKLLRILKDRGVKPLAVPAQQPAKPAAKKITKASPFSTRLTPNFTYGEFALNQEERRFGQNYQIETAIELAQFLEKLRAHFGKPVRITSGHRPQAVNRAVGGASSSEHLYDAPGVGAVDVVVVGEPIEKVQAWIDREWPYSVGLGAPKGFVHVGLRAGRPKVRWPY